MNRTSPQTTVRANTTTNVAVLWPSIRRGRSCAGAEVGAGATGKERSRRQPNRLASRDMEDAESSEKISLHPLDDFEEEPPKKELTWRQKVAAFLECNKVQWGIIALVILDCLIVVFELLIDIEIIVIPEDHHEVTNSSSHLADNNLHAIHPDPHHHNVTHNITDISHHGDGEEDHDEHHAPNKHMVEHILHLASLAILSIFFVEVICKIIAEGTHLLKHKAEVFDAIVVVVSFTMDVTFTFVSVDQAARDYAGLLVVLRLWRFTRIINGVILSVKMDADKKINKEKALRNKAEEQVQRLTDKVDQLTADNEKLRARLKRMMSNNGTVSTPSEKSCAVEGMERTMSEKSNLTGLDRPMPDKNSNGQGIGRTQSDKNFNGQSIGRTPSDKNSSGHGVLRTQSEKTFSSDGTDRSTSNFNGEASKDEGPSPSDKGVS